MCSCKCSSSYKPLQEHKRKTVFKKYGVNNVSQSKEIKDQKIRTQEEHFGVTHHLKLDSQKEKQKNTINKKYGVNNVSQAKEIKNKRKNTFLDKYNVENAFQVEEFKEKSKQSCIKKYGVVYYTKSQESKNKAKEYYTKKYGVKSSLQIKEVKEKIKKIWLKNLGVDNPSKSKKVSSKIKKSLLKKIVPKVKQNLKNINLILINDYNNSSIDIEVKCLVCNHIFTTKYSNIQQGCGFCSVCYPKHCSVAEQEIKKFIKSLGFETIENSKKLIPPYELDIYISEKKFAIEYNGLYWHSENQGKDKFYHLKKLELCLEKNITLIQIFEDEWLHKKDIVKNRLKQLLKVSNAERIHARLCKIKEIANDIKNKFLNCYHLQGQDTSSIRLGAFYSDKLVSVMTFSRGSIAKGAKITNNFWELNRFCICYNYHIPGIASKLLKHFQRNYEWINIYSYADRRWSTGNVYNVLGFKEIHCTLPNYWYVKGNIRLHRYGLRKRPNESKDIPEWILRTNEGYSRIWDCGVIKFNLTK